MFVYLFAVLFVRGPESWSQRRVSIFSWILNPSRTSIQDSGSSNTPMIGFHAHMKLCAEVASVVLPMCVTISHAFYYMSGQKTRRQVASCASLYGSYGTALQCGHNQHFSWLSFTAMMSLHTGTLVHVDSYVAVPGRKMNIINWLIQLGLLSLCWGSIDQKLLRR